MVISVWTITVFLSARLSLIPCHLSYPPSLHFSSSSTSSSILPPLPPPPLFHSIVPHKGVNAVATIRSTKKHGSAHDQLERQLSQNSQMSAMERLRPGVTTLPSKPVLKGTAAASTNGVEETMSAPPNDAGSNAMPSMPTDGGAVADGLNTSSHSQGKTVECPGWEVFFCVSGVVY